MGNIALKENAELNLDMEAMTEETEGHCDEWNTRYKQLLENEKYFEEKRKEYDQELEKIKLLRASFEAYGMVKVTDSAAVTDSTGLALAATEKNASIQGTLANQISSLNTDFENASVPRLHSETTADSVASLLKQKCKLIINGNYKEYTWVNQYGVWLGAQSGTGFFQKHAYLVFVIYISHTFAFFGIYDSSSDTLSGKLLEYSQF